MWHTSRAIQSAMLPRACTRAVFTAAARHSAARASTAASALAARRHLSSVAATGGRFGHLRSGVAAPSLLSRKRCFSTKEIVTPEFGAESITEGSIQEWQKKVGDFCAKGDIIVVIETDKVSIEVKAEEHGTLEEICAQVDDTVVVGQKLAVIKPGGEPPAKPAAAAAAAAPAAPAAPAAAAKPAAAAPAAKPAPAAAAKPAPAAAAAAPPSATGSRGERRVKLTRMRQAVSRRLKEAQNTTAMLTTFQEVDMGPLMEMRKEYKELFEKTHGGVRLGFMSAFLKASCFALEQIPAINAVIDDATNEIVYRDFVDISVAVASPKGLVVPVVRNVESKSIFQIEKSISDLANLARKDALTLDDMSGGTFTISNGGVFGSMLGTPLINLPQSAILGMHATKMRPVVLKNGEIAPRPIMYLALTYDHRLVDGREAVTFLCTVRDQIEDPRRLLLQV
eukprot:TRINITY_DN110993_c0_g1_i1.p1 TRINITY_DN110993_c0_g1~~TRINITY_DN110993_c0_g1_i1.p1  ORF type:complete len:452 (+),score=136.14 TRINITY_DN110993_c0_g1_i1:53-1408(+)